MTGFQQKMINKPQQESNIDDLINQIKDQHSNKKKESMDKSNHQPNSTEIYCNALSRNYNNKRKNLNKMIFIKTNQK